MKRRDLEILLSVNVKGFSDPKIHLEQYQTPPRVAANLIHWAMLLGDITEKTVVDLCSGTGILAISAALLDAKVTAIEIDPDAVKIFQSNINELELEVDIIREDVFKYLPKKFDTALINPPFGLQQKKYSDIDFLIRATEIADIVYSIHDGSPGNQKELPNLLLKNKIEFIDAYIDEFPLDKLYPWHKLKKKMHRVMIIRSRLIEE